jgi:hypothetical protein
MKTTLSTKVGILKMKKILIGLFIYSFFTIKANAEYFTVQQAQDFDSLYQRAK